MQFHKQHPILLAVIGVIIGGLIVTIIASLAALNSNSRTASYYDATGSYDELDIDFGYAEEEAAGSLAARSYDDTVSSDVSAAEQKIIKTGTVYITVESADEAANALAGIAQTYGGYVLTTSLTTGDDGFTSGYVTFKVSEEHFEVALNDAKKLATGETSEYISAEDVTEEYLDLEARLRNAQAQEERYLEILARASTIQDILSVEGYLSMTREEIEVLQGQINYLDSRTDYSTITVYVSEDAQIIFNAPGFRPGETFDSAVNVLINIFQAIVSLLIYLVVVALPIAIIAFVIWRIVRAIRRRHNRK